MPSTTSNYNATILADEPVMFLGMHSPSLSSETDLTGNGHDAVYKGGMQATATMPNGDAAAVFNGVDQYATVPSSAALSIPTTGELTWEGWIRPDVLTFSKSTGGYVDWMGKCQNYSPTCEWEARMYNETNPQSRNSRLSAYAFNKSAGLGSGADWQQKQGQIQAGQWLHVVAEYQTHTTPAVCSNAFPGTLNIWVNGVKWNQSTHGTTGCMSQYAITPTASSSPLNIGTMAFDSWFPGSIGKVAVYDHLLTPVQITSHFSAMTGSQPTGSCAATCTLH
jgi:hypothetical protein